MEDENGMKINKKVMKFDKEGENGMEPSKVIKIDKGENDMTMSKKVIEIDKEGENGMEMSKKETEID